MAGLKGDENFEVRYQCNDCTPSSGMHIFSANTSEQVTEAWLIKGTGGEFIVWYWDPEYTIPLILGEDVRTEYCVMQSGKTLVFGLYGKTQMDIKLKMGAKNSLPSAKDRGTVYFAKDGNKNFGELYYDDENGNRVKVGGSNISQISFQNKNVWLPLPADMIIGNNLLINITMEDGSIISSDPIPACDVLTSGIITPNLGADGEMSLEDPKSYQQMPIGIKSFFPGIQIGAVQNGEIAIQTGMIIDSKFLTDDNSTTVGEQLAIIGSKSVMLIDQLFGAGFAIANYNDYPVVGAMAGEKAMQLTTDGFWTDSLGYESNYIPAAFIESITANTITATAFTGLFTGNLSGNANTATTLLTGRNINGTLFDGSADITTESWGTARNVKISNQADASVDGLSVDGARDIVLTIPSTMTNFVSITSTDLFGTNLGSKTSIWDSLHIENPIIYNPLDNSYFHKLVSKSNSTTGRTLNLPDSDGTLVFITSAIGDENSPAYVASSGQVQACTSIAVEHGGTGRDALTAGSLLVGNGTSAVTLVTGDTKGKILSSNGSSSAPSYVSPSLSWTDGGASGPTLKLSINSADTTSTIPIASGTVSGVISTGEQTFSGKKIFSGAIQGNSTLAITGTSTFTGQITAANMILTGQLKSSANTSYSYMTLADTKITLKSSAIFLDGSKLLLNTTSSNMYGTTLPTTGLEEGRVFFLLV